VSQIRLYLDEDALQESLLRALQSSSVDVMTVADAERLSFSDEEQLIWAAQQRSTLGYSHQKHIQQTGYFGICMLPENTGNDIRYASQNVR
jgi:hypothetical protein